MKKHALVSSVKMSDAIGVIGNVLRSFKRILDFNMRNVYLLMAAAINMPGS